MRLLLTTTELGMLAYWAFAAVVALGWIAIAPEFMYPDYTNPLIVIWNWSFLPIDVMFALCGLIARFGSLPQHQAHILSVVSLTLMFCAGVMAIAFWTLQCWFDLAWWGLNVWLIVLATAGLLQTLCTDKGQTA